MDLSFFNRTRSSRRSGANLLVLHDKVCTLLGATISRAAVPALTLYSLNVEASFWSQWKESSSSSELILAFGLNLHLSVP